jgi:3-oxoacyl-[acyl-carrier-protein] synthase II
MRRRVVITGLGCVSPVGNNVETSWDNILSGRSGAGRITLFDPSEFKVQIAAEVKEFDPDEIFGRREARKMDRYTHFALASALEALEDSKLSITEGNKDRIGAVIGSGIGGIGTTEEQSLIERQQGPGRVSPFFIPMMLPDIAGGILAIQLGIRGPNMAVVTACASGNNAIGEAAEIIRRGDADVMFTGGTEATIVPITIGGMASMNALSTRNEEPERASRPFDKDRDGFVMGEGAAIMILEDLDHALARGANILGEMMGYGATNDAHHISAPAEHGSGAARCMQMALDDAELTTMDIDYINAHGTSTQLNDLNETEAIKSVFGEQAYSIPVSSTKSMTGHIIGGTGAMEAVFCVKAIQESRIPPTINYETPDPECDLDYVPNQAREKTLGHVMSNSFGFGGHNATIILSQFAN